MAMWQPIATIARREPEPWSNGSVQGDSEDEGVQRTVVSVTPVALERDSRTLKQAASVARLGYDSVVIERHSSGPDLGDLPFKLRSVGRLPEPRIDARGVERSRRRATILARLAGRLGRLALHLPGAKYAIDRLYWYGIRTLCATPKASLYYLHAFYQFPAVQLRCWMHGARFIYDAHDLYTIDNEAPSPSWRYRTLRVPFERWLEAQCVRRAAAVVTVSDSIAELHSRNFGRRPRVIRNCDDQRLHRIPSHSIRVAAGIAPTDFLFVVVGNAKEGQALLQLLAALPEVPARVHVALLGMRYESFRDQIHVLGLASRVHILAPVKPFEVVPFIQTADAAMILYYARSLNYLYCLPNGFFQAVAAGLPLLYPNLPELSKLAAEYRLGVVIDPLSPASIAEGVLAFFHQPNRLAEFRRNAERARDLLNWEREEHVLAAVLSEALRGDDVIGKG